MKKSPLSTILDLIFIDFIIFVIMFVWINKFIKNAKLSNFYSIIMIVLLFLLELYYVIKNFKSKKLKLSDKKLLNNCYENIMYFNKSKLNIFYEKLLNAKNVDEHIYKNDNSYFYINLKNELSSIDFNKAFEFYLETDKNSNLCFLGKNYSSDFLKLNSLSKFKFIIFDEQEIIQAIKASNFNFEINETNKTNFLIKFKNNINHSLTKSKFKNLFFSGLSLVSISLFIPHSIYYLLMGSILLILSMLCLFSKTKIPTKPAQQSLISLINKNEADQNIDQLHKN